MSMPDDNYDYHNQINSVAGLSLSYRWPVTLTPLM